MSKELECNVSASGVMTEPNLLPPNSYLLNSNFEKLSVAKARSSFEGAAAVCESEDTHVTQAPAVGRVNHDVRVFFTGSIFPCQPRWKGVAYER